MRVELIQINKRADDTMSYFFLVVDLERTWQNHESKVNDFGIKCRSVRNVFGAILEKAQN